MRNHAYKTIAGQYWPDMQKGEKKTLGMDLSCRLSVEQLATATIELEFDETKIIASNARVFDDVIGVTIEALKVGHQIVTVKITTTDDTVVKLDIKVKVY